MRITTFCDEPMTAGRTPYMLLVLADGGLVRFVGNNILGVCAITSESYRKNGKWSGSTYSLALATGVRPVDCSAPMHGTVCGNAASFEEALTFLNRDPEGPRVTRPALDAILATGLWPKTAARWAENEAALASLG